MTNVLFVCTGNAFRSLSAEFALRSALPEGSAVKASSAGIRTTSAHPIHKDVRARFAEKGLDTRTHTPRQLTKDIFDGADLVVAMGTDHARYIEETFGQRVPLYMEIVSGERAGVPDNWEAVADHESRPEENRAYIRSVIDMIFNNAAAFTKNMEAFLPDAAKAGLKPQTPRPG